MVLSYYNKFDDFDEFVKKNINTINPGLYCLLLSPLLFIGNIGPILVVSIISLLNIYIYPELPFIEEEEESQSSDDEEQSSDDEE